jgi:hypothetical protein
VRLHRAPVVAPSRIRLENPQSWVSCIFCGSDPRGVKVALGLAPGPKDRFDLCFTCADVMRPCIGPPRFWTCQCCGKSVRPGFALKRHATTVDKFHFCEPCALKLVSLSYDHGLRAGSITLLEWEGVPA